jgi:hypothetical protein
MMTTPEVFQIPVSGDVGYIREWKPQKRTMVMIAQIQEIMAEWEAEKVTPVKNRTLFYRMGVLLAEEMEVSLTDPTILATGEHFFGLTPIGVAIAANMAKTPVRQVTGRVVQ